MLLSKIVQDSLCSWDSTLKVSSPPAEVDSKYLLFPDVGDFSGVWMRGEHADGRQLALQKLGNVRLGAP